MHTPHPSASQTPETVLKAISHYLGSNFEGQERVLAYRCLDEKGLDHAVYVTSKKSPKTEGYFLVLMCDHTREVKRLFNYEQKNPSNTPISDFMDLDVIPVLAPDDLEMWDPDEEDKSEDRLVEHQSVTLIPADLRTYMENNMSPDYIAGISAVRQLSMFRFAVFYQDTEEHQMDERFVTCFDWDGDNDLWDEYNEDKVMGMSISEFLGLPVRYTLDM